MATLLERNKQFANTFTHADMPALPLFRSVILTCVDPRVDPAYILGVGLGEAVVMRNNGGRVTQAVLEEIATLAFMVAQMEGDLSQPGSFELVLMQHTQCGAERYCDPKFQEAVKQHLGVDVTPSAIDNHVSSLNEDGLRLQRAAMIPDYVQLSGYVYDVKTGLVHEVIPSTTVVDFAPVSFDLDAIMATSRCQVS